MIIDTSKKSFWISVVVIVFICVFLFMWYNHKTAITTEEIIQSSKEAIKASKEAAEKEAKRIAAATWNKHHPDNPVTNKPHRKKK